MIKTKLFSSIAKDDPSIDQLINRWIDDNANIKVIDIKYQTELGQTGPHILTMLSTALILYEDKPDNEHLQYVAKKAMYDYQFKELQKQIKPALNHFDMCKVNNKKVNYEIVWHEPSVATERGPQFDLLFRNDKGICAVVESYWKDKEIIGALVSGSDPSNKQILEMAEDTLKLYLPEYTYRFDERIL